VRERPQSFDSYTGEAKPRANGVVHYIPVGLESRARQRAGEEGSMSENDSVDAQRRRLFDQIWTQLPERQNRTSSSWWFFILFPEGDEGYGPRQLMFSIATRVGDEIRVNDVTLPGLDLDREVVDGVDTFDAISVGWDGDDESVDEHVIKQPARTTLSEDGFIEAWSDDGGESGGERRGSEIRASEDHPFGLDAEFVGEKGSAKFQAWGEMDSPISSPVQSMDMDTVAGGVDVLAWRRMRFEGEFDLSSGEEHLEGWCYFQRVCMNVPLYPWKWVWVVFPDESAFSVMVPFVGPQLFRSGYGYSSSSAMEELTVPVRQSGIWHDGDSDETVEFPSASVTPILDDGPYEESDASGSHPDFRVRAETDDGEYVEFVARSYGHARNYIDRDVLGGRAETHWSYNEYLVEVDELEASVDGYDVNDADLGAGYGTLEYSWGLGL